MTEKRIRANRPGIDAPVVAGRAGLATSAWRNLDNPKSRPKFHCVLKRRGRPDIELLDLTPDLIKEIGEQFAQVHKQIVGSKKPKRR